MTVANVTLQQGNAGSGAGGAVYADNSLVLSDTNILSSTTTGSAGGAWVNASATVIGGVFQNNTCLTAGCACLCRPIAR